MTKCSDSDLHRLGMTSSTISTLGIKNIINILNSQRHRNMTRQNYYAVWKVFNQFFVRLDVKPSTWEDQLILFVEHLVQNNRKSATVKSYISAIKAVLYELNIVLQEDWFLLTALTKACKLRNDQISIRMPIRKSMVVVLTKKIGEVHGDQPFLSCLYKMILLTAYFGLFRIGKLTSGDHPVLTRDIHIGQNKDKFLFVLRTSKTHWKDVKPQMVKILRSSISSRNECRMAGVTNTNFSRTKPLPCPFEHLRSYLKLHGTYITDSEPFFVFKDRNPVKPFHFRQCLKLCLRKLGFDERNYNMHSLRLGRSCDLYKLGLSIDHIKKLGRWKLNAVFKYLKNC